MTSYTRTGVSGGSSQLYLGTHDNTVYTFGFDWLNSCKRFHTCEKSYLYPR